jgi:hypothetical protein
MTRPERAEDVWGGHFRLSSWFAFAKPIYRPFRAGGFLNPYLGLKPQAESYCPFGAETEFIMVTHQSPITNHLSPSGL